jgi:hypothetical protein
VRRIDKDVQHYLLTAAQNARSHMVTAQLIPKHLVRKLLFGNARIETLFRVIWPSWKARALKQSLAFAGILRPLVLA